METKIKKIPETGMREMLLTDPRAASYATTTDMEGQDNRGKESSINTSER